MINHELIRKTKPKNYSMLSPCYPMVSLSLTVLSGARTRLGHGGGAGLGAAGRRGFGRGECAEAQGRPRGPGMGWCLEDRSISISIDIEWYRFDMFFFGILYRVIQNIFRYLLYSNIWHTFWVRIGWNHAKTDSDLGIMGNHIALGFRWMT
jgi:hypothetical protein